MGIYLRNMEMPERCGACFLRVGGCKQRIYMEHRPKGCPLVEVKEPHGRLIDADALLNKTIRNPLWSPYITKKMVLDAKTVIEAEGSEE